MAIPVEMPKMSDTMEEGILVAWLAEEGQNVSAGDVIAQVETDKATMDLEVYDDGVLLRRVIGEGEAVPIGGLIAVLGKAGEDFYDIVGFGGAESVAHKNNICLWIPEGEEARLMDHPEINMETHPSVNNLEDLAEFMSDKPSRTPSPSPFTL